MATAADMSLPLAERAGQGQLPSARFFLRMADEMYENAQNILTQLKYFVTLRQDAKMTIGAPPTFVSVLSLSRIHR